MVFHPHADTHVDTQDRILEFLKDTDPQFVNLCLDTGHIAYCDGDNLQIIEQRPRTRSPMCISSWSTRRSGNGSSGRNCPSPKRCRWASWSNPRTANPKYPPCWTPWPGLDREIFTVIEQDLYPIESHLPLAIQARAAGYFVGQGLGPIRRWPY